MSRAHWYRVLCFGLIAACTGQSPPPRHAGGAAPQASKPAVAAKVSSKPPLRLLTVAAADTEAEELRLAAAHGFDPARLARIDQVTEREIAAGRLRGAVTLIARRGEIVQFRAYGMRHSERQTPMTKDTIFRIYSMSKPITSVAAMILWEEGKLGLDDPVSKYLPQLAELKVAVDPERKRRRIETTPAEREMTVRDLLRHTSGLTYGFFGDTAVDAAYREAGVLRSDEDLSATVQKLARLPLQYEPGTRWHYSVSTDVLGRLVEVISGQRFDEFLRARLFEPLDMRDTGFSVASDAHDRLAALYTPTENGKLAPSKRSSRRFTEPATHLSGGGGLVSTARDYFRFCEMLRRGGSLDGVRVLSPQTVELMTRDHLGELAIRPGLGFGLGFGVVTDPGLAATPASTGTYRWGGAAGTSFWIDEAEELVGIYMVQIMRSEYDHAETFRNLVYQALVGAPD